MPKVIHTLILAPAPETADALNLSHVEISYRVRREQQRVVRDVSFHVARGELFGLVGESGCGKSTIELGVVRWVASARRLAIGVTGG